MREYQIMARFLFWIVIVLMTPLATWLLGVWRGWWEP